MVFRVSMNAHTFSMALAATLFAWPTLASATEGAPLPAEASAEFAGLPPSAGLVASPAFSKTSVVANFYSLTDVEQGQRVPRWIGRVSVGTGAQWRVRWADGETCPQLKDSIAAMTRLAPVSFSFRGNQVYAPAPKYVADGTWYTLWGRNSVQPDGSPVWVEASSNTGPLAEWAEATLRALEPCLQETQPRGRSPR